MNIQKSLRDDSPTVLMDAETGERIAHWVEVDMSMHYKAAAGEGRYFRDAYGNAFMDEVERLEADGQLQQAGKDPIVLLLHVSGI